MIAAKPAPSLGGFAREAKWAHERGAGQPKTSPLVLTKMMRGNDEQDMADAEFMIRHDRITKGQMMDAFSRMNPVGLVELRDAFARAKPVVHEPARKAATAP